MVSKNELESFQENIFPKEILNDLLVNFRIQIHQFKNDLKELTEMMNEYVLATNEILADQYVLGLFIEIEKLIRKNAEFGEWHDLRKLIKQWMYAINWIDDLKDRDISYYQKLQEAIGYWHDMDVIKETIQQKKSFFQKI